MNPRQPVKLLPCVYCKWVKPEWPLDKESFSQLIAAERVTNQLTTISKTDESENLWISYLTQGGDGSAIRPRLACLSIVTF